MIDLNMLQTEAIELCYVRGLVPYEAINNYPRWVHVAQELADIISAMQVLRKYGRL